MNKNIYSTLRDAFQRHGWQDNGNIFESLLLEAKTFSTINKYLTLSKLAPKTDPQSLQLFTILRFLYPTQFVTF